MGLGNVAIKEGRETEGVELLRHSLAASAFTEHDSGKYELGALECLTQVLFKTGKLEEVYPCLVKGSLSTLNPEP